MWIYVLYISKEGTLRCLKMCLPTPAVLNPTFLFVLLCGVSWSPLGVLCPPRMMDGDECGAVGGRLTAETRSARRKPAPESLSQSQIPYDLNRAGTRAAAGGCRRIYT
jgi:hypothetical protein